MEKTYTTIRDDELKTYMHALYNIWFAKWKKKVNMSDSDWLQCVEEVLDITKNTECNVVTKIGIALLTELEERNKRKGIV